MLLCFTLSPRNQTFPPPIRSPLWTFCLNPWEIWKHSHLGELLAAANMTTGTRYYICPMLISITATHYSDQPEAIYNHLWASAHHFHNWLEGALTQQLVGAVNHCQRIEKKALPEGKAKLQCLSIVGSKQGNYTFFILLLFFQSLEQYPPETEKDQKKVEFTDAFVLLKETGVKLTGLSHTSLSFHF